MKTLQSILKHDYVNNTRACCQYLFGFWTTRSLKPTNTCTSWRVKSHSHLRALTWTSAKSVIDALRTAVQFQQPLIQHAPVIIHSNNVLHQHSVCDSCGAIFHYNDIIMGTIASQITSLMIVYSTVYSDVDQRKHQRSASLAFVWGIHRGPVNYPHKWPVTRKMFPFDGVIMCIFQIDYA